MSELPHGWRKLARGLRLKINCGWWLQMCSAPLAGVSLALMGAVLWAPRFYPRVAEDWRGPVVAVSLGAVLLAGWWWARRRFVGEAGALALLESRLGLHNRLSTAAAGVCAWPAVPARTAHGIRWAAGQTLAPVLAAAAFLVAAWWVPVTAAVRPIPDEPAAWKTTEAELRALEETKSVDPQSVRQVREKVAELRAQDPGKWFSHGSLEASDRVREAHLRAGDELRSNLRQAARGAARLAEGAAGLEAGARANLQDQFKQAVEAMKAGAMKPDPEMMKALREIDPSALGEIDPEKMKEMIEKLREMAGDIEQAMGRGEEAGEDGDGEGRDGENGDNPDGKGGGGVARGPGTNKRLFGKERREIDAAKPGVLESADLSKARPGEVLGTSDIERELDRSSPQLRSGGKADDAGGGSGAWRESLNPKEQDALKRFFE